MDDFSKLKLPSNVILMHVTLIMLLQAYNNVQTLYRSVMLTTTGDIKTFKSTGNAKLNTFNNNIVSGS